MHMTHVSYIYKANSWTFLNNVSMEHGMCAGAQASQRALGETGARTTEINLPDDGRTRRAIEGAVAALATCELEFASVYNLAATYDEEHIMGKGVAYQNVLKEKGKDLSTFVAKIKQKHRELENREKAGPCDEIGHVKQCLKDMARKCETAKKLIISFQKNEGKAFIELAGTCEEDGLQLNHNILARLWRCEVDQGLMHGLVKEIADGFQEDGQGRAKQILAAAQSHSVANVVSSCAVYILEDSNSN